jgi:hypothetical protein
VVLKLAEKVEYMTEWWSGGQNNPDIHSDQAHATPNGYRSLKKEFPSLLKTRWGGDEGVAQKQNKLELALALGA